MVNDDETSSQAYLPSVHFLGDISVEIVCFILSYFLIVQF
jgi:hypothetical protein